MKRFGALGVALTFAAIPLFPSFIALTSVAFPGVSLLPKPETLVLLGLVTVVAIFELFAVMQKPREPVVMLVPLLLWYGAAFASAILGLDPAAGLLFVTIFGATVLWHVAVVRFYRVPGAPALMYRCFLWSGALAALTSIVMVATRVPAALYTIGHGRAIGPFILPGELAGFLIVYLAVAFGVARTTAARDLRVVAWIGLAVGAVALLLTFSRAGWMGFAAALAFLVVARGLPRRYAVVVVCVAIALVAVLFNAHHNPSENYTRISIWRAAWSVVERFPLTGVGPFVFSEIYPYVRQPDGDPTAFHAHSFFLTIAAEMGLVGLGAVVYAWWRFARALSDRLRTASARHATLALAIAAGLLGTLVQGLIDTVTIEIFCLWLPTMALSLMAASDGLRDA